jgi:hypothetical protein
MAICREFYLLLRSFFIHKKNKLLVENRDFLATITAGNLSKLRQKCGVYPQDWW